MPKVLVANRGEIAIRVMRALRELGLRSVAVYSEADREALFVRYADEAYYLGPAPAIDSYLNIREIMRIAREAKVNAIHPGYGFLAENPNFAYACEQEGIKFIGPSSRVIALMGNKVAARIEAERAGVPVVPGASEHVSSLDQARVAAAELGYPVMVKPSGGGAGIGMIIVNSEAELERAINAAQSIASNTFAIGAVYLEKYLPNARHIEFQILGDSRGNIVHLGERECSIQRRHQKLVEEAPSPVLDQGLRAEMGKMAIRLAKQVNYQSAGTMEFLYSDGRFYFLEANARIQVEHPVTEMVTGIDIVKEQILLALGEPLSFSQDEVKINGWAIECRINAEDPLNNFAPSPGKLRGYRSPGGIGVRVDSGVHTRYTIPSHYDPMISKLIVWGRDRGEAIVRMRRALYEYIIVGVKTNLIFHKAVMENPRFVEGALGTHFVEEEYATLLQDMRRLAAREYSLEEKLAQIFQDKKKMAAIAAAALVSQISPKSR